MKTNFYMHKKLNISNISYGFFTKIEGFSNDNYASLNCNYNTDNYKNMSQKNINIAKKNLGLGKSKLKFISQIHSNQVVVVDKNNFSTSVKADGSITQDKDISLAVLTADCCPIFIYDSDINFICCLHAGWKGCLLNIVGSALKQIQTMQSNVNKIFAIIGPCLNKSNFEVSFDFKEQFILQNSYYDKFFTYIDNAKKTLFDMRGLIQFQFNNNMINNVYNIDIDTYENEDLFFSHRRSNHNETLPTGRMVNIIGFKK